MLHFVTQQVKFKGRWAIACLTIIACLTLASSQVQAWNSGTHLYFGNVLGSTVDPSNWQEMYGAMALDTFNFGSDQYSTYMSDLLHSDAAIQLWNAAKIAGIQYQPVAFGFMTHNNVWGADSTAHNNGLTYGQGNGYVIAKAQLLHTVAPLPAQLNIPLSVELLMDHLVVENAVDVLMKQYVDVNLGKEIYQAALTRPTQFPALLVSAYAGNLMNQFSLTAEQAQTFIITSELQFQNITEMYGQALDTDQPVSSLAAMLALIAENYLGNLPITDEQLKNLLSVYITAAMGLCSDFGPEIAATKDFVALGLQQHDISYDISAVPLPPTLLLFSFGLLSLGLFKLKS
jgi:hypothetical protein